MTPAAIIQVLGGSNWLALTAIPLFLVSFRWHWRGRSRFHFSRQSVQANHELARRGRRGAAYFGGLLGVGVLTEMSSPLVWTSLVYAAVTGVSTAASYAVGFALGRSTPALAAAVWVGATTDPHEVTIYVVVRLRRYTRWLGVPVAALGGLASAAVGLGLS